MLEPICVLSKQLNQSFTVCLFEPRDSDDALDSLLHRMREAGLEEPLFVSDSVEFKIFSVIRVRFKSRLIGEILFWKENYVRLLSRGHKASVLHTETFLSDVMAASIIAPGGIVLLINSLNDMSENYVSLWNLIRKRVTKSVRQVLGQTPFRDNVLHLYVRNFFYRLLVPRCATMVLGRKSGFQPARRFVSGALSDTYIVGPAMARRLYGRLGDKEIVAVDPTPEESNSALQKAGNNCLLLVLSELPVEGRALDDYAEALISDLQLVSRSLDFQSVVIRPHPRFMPGLSRLADAISSLGHEVEIANPSESIEASCARASHVAGVWSSALYQAAKYSERETFGLLTPSLIEDPDLVLETYGGVRWVPEPLLTEHRQKNRNAVTDSPTSDLIILSEERLSVILRPHLEVSLL
jgi:hypothetical protein